MMMSLRCAANAEIGKTQISNDTIAMIHKSFFFIVTPSFFVKGATCENRLDANSGRSYR